MKPVCVSISSHRSTYLLHPSLQFHQVLLYPYTLKVFYQPAHDDTDPDPNPDPPPLRSALLPCVFAVFKILERLVDAPDSDQCDYDDCVMLTHHCSATTSMARAVAVAERVAARALEYETKFLTSLGYASRQEREGLNKREWEYAGGLPDCIWRTERAARGVLEEAKWSGLCR
jgi:hypothetical protein